MKIILAYLTVVGGESAEMPSLKIVEKWSRFSFGISLCCFLLFHVQSLQIPSHPLPEHSSFCVTLTSRDTQGMLGRIFLHVCGRHGRPMSHDSRFKNHHVMQCAINKEVIDAILCLLNHLVGAKHALFVSCYSLVG